MKKVEAIVQPYKVDDVKDALIQIGVRGLTILEAKGFGRQKGASDEPNLSGDIFRPKVKLETVIEDSMVERAIEAIRFAAPNGKIGDGKIFVSDIEDVVRIRTGERGTIAL